MSNKFQGHKNWNHWNVSLWINNDYGLYQEAKQAIKESNNKDEAAESLMYQFKICGLTHTPDGAPYTKTSIRAAMVGM